MTSKGGNTTKHFKDRHPDQMKGFKQVSFNLIFRSSVMIIISYFNLNVGLINIAVIAELIVSKSAANANIMSIRIKFLY